MRYLLHVLINGLLLLSIVKAETEQPVRRRPRIRVYDQETNSIPVVKPVEHDQQTETDLDRKIRSDVQARAGFQDPVSTVSFLPILNPSSENTQTANEDEEESWVTPMDFLLDEERPQEEDLLLMDNEEVTTGEMEITDWEELQKTMIEEALKTEEPEMTDEEIEEQISFDQRQEERAIFQSAGMEMENIAPVDEIQDSHMANESLRDTSLSSGQFVPILRDQRQVAGEINRPQAQRNFELKGSQTLLNNLKEKWSKPSDVSASRPSGRLNTGALPTQSLMGRSVAEPRGLSNFPGSNPAIRPLPSSVSVQPETEVRVRPQPAAELPAQGSSFPREDFRIRSQLGVPLGR